MKPNRHLLIVAVVLLASGGNALLAGDTAGDEAKRDRVLYGHVRCPSLLHEPG